MTTAGGTTAGGEESGDDRGGPGVAGGAAAQKVLLVTSSGASPHAVVPVLAAAEAAGLQVRAIDLGGAGAGGSSVTDRVRRALLGEGAERRLRKELEQNPPDVAVVFDPHSAQALTVARDEVANPAPVLAVVAELEPAAAWSQTDADRFLALDDVAAVALAEHGVEPDRVLVAGAFGEIAFWQAGQADRAELRRKFNLSGQVVLIEASGLGAELTNQLALQLSLLDAHDRTTFLFDAAGDAESAAVLRRSVPTLGLRAKLFGATADAALLWRAADVVIARPSTRAASRVLLLGARLVALVDDTSPGLAANAAALEARKVALPARGLLLLTSALDAALRQGPPAAGGPDGAASCAEVLAVLARDKHAVIDERRAATNAVMRERIRAMNTAAASATRAAAMPGELEDLSGAPGAEFASASSAASPIASVDVDALLAEGKLRLAELTKAMMAAQRAADAAAAEAVAQRARGEADPAAVSERRSSAERARMHSLLGEMSTLQGELTELGRVAAAAPRSAGRSANPSRGAASTAGGAAGRTAGSVEDLLADLKSKAASGGGPAPRSGPDAARASARPPADNLDDELAALKQKMAQSTSAKKKG
ncbi:MAG: hypothetical protein IPI49_18725 [Myxococcales bacterium]|jgi:UDP-N-acetylglucosamine:LPS N-acetylglucosamine transferase|nr:hypothetical protein [Myxococcales bacterium]